jgi:hypothetical protein
MVLKNDGITGDVVVPSVYWNFHGPVPVKFIVMLTGVVSQIVVVPVMVAVGLSKTVMLNGTAVLEQPATEFKAVSVAEYTPAGTVAGIEI